jgi:murein L,D-transpeptidase YafK
MTRRTWFNESGNDHIAMSENTDIESSDIETNETSDADNLWTRRSALALTAGILAMGTAPGQARAFTQKIQPRADHVVVSKRNRVLELRSGTTILKRYTVHLGFAPEGHKLRSGDGRTPEGRYYINRRNPRSDFFLSLGVSYPNPVDMARARAAGVQPGGDIFIHGGPRKAADQRKRDWTAGCIAVSDREMEEIWSMVPTGTPITILA